MSQRPTYSLVVPVFNEEAVLPLLFCRLDRVLDGLDGPSEVIVVDDGSRDASRLIAQAKVDADPRYRLVPLSRNFGHQVAITAGLDMARGDAAIVIDADLQDPPELIFDLVAKWREGYDVVCAQRTSRDGESRFKKVSADLFYRCLSRLASVEIPRNVGDCRLMNRRVLDAFRSMPERERFVRGMVAWIGFRQALVPYQRASRAAGTTKYPIRRMARLAADALVGFSEAPLRLSLWVGMVVSILGMLYGCVVIAMWLTRADLVPGWSSTIVVTTFLCGANMLMTGIMGLYVGRIYSEVKGRPLYVMENPDELRPNTSELGDARDRLAALEARFSGEQRAAS